MLDKIDPNELLSGLKKTIDAGKEGLVYKHTIPSSKTRETIDVRPSMISLHLKGYFTEKVNFLNRGVSGKSNYNNSTLNLGIIIDDNIITRANYVPIAELPKYSGENLFFEVTRFMFLNYPSLAQKHLSKKVVENKKAYFAPKKNVKYIEGYRGRSSMSKDLEKKFIALNSKFHSLKNVTTVGSNVTNEMSFEIFVDSDGSEIVQYFDDLTISFDLSFINLNHMSVPISIVKRFKTFDELPETFFSDIENELLHEMEKRKKFATIKSGTYTVKLAPNATNVFIHEGITAHILSGDYIVNGESTIFDDRLGYKYESLDGVNFIMDPTIKDAYGSFKYDCEGVEAKRVVMVENGVIKRYLTGRYSSAQLEMAELDIKIIEQLIDSDFNKSEILLKYVDAKYIAIDFDSDYEKFYSLLNNHLLSDFINEADDIDNNLDWRTHHNILKKESNGHARIETWLGVDYNGEYFGVVPEARMSNLIIETDYETSEDLSEEMNELAQNLDDEFYLEIESYSGEVDPQTGHFTIKPHFVNKVSVKDGTKEPVVPGLISIHLEDFINHIYLVGSKNTYESGQCGAGSGFIPVASKTPYMIVLSVSYQAAPKIEQVTEEYYDALLFKNKRLEEKGE